MVRYLKNSETIPATKYIAVSESRLEKETQAIINLLHRKSYWVVCVDRVMDGALLRGDSSTEYSIIGFSTGKGTYGQYNLTITARKSILETVQRRLTDRLRQLFHWKQAAIDAVVARIVNEASTLDGISLLSAINQRDYNINEFMAYVLTSLREREKASDCALRIIVHLDSYRHWFANDDTPSSRPDFLMLSVLPSNEILRLRATVIECKISSYRNSSGHIEKAKNQVCQGLEQLQRIFDPDSESIERRYWFSQLYRALVFAQVTFSNNSDEFESLSAKLRSVLDGKFSIEWAGEILGYWFDMPGTDEVVTTDSNGITICNIPQIQIQKILSATHNEVSFIDIPEETISTEEKDDDSEIEDLERKNQIELQDLNARGRVEQPVPQKGDDTSSDPPHIASQLAEKDADASHAKMPGEKPLESTLPTGVIQTDKPTLAEQPSTISLQQEFSLETSRISIGKDRKGNEVFWEFGNTQLANRHLLITGTSGQGKTYSIQTMLYTVLAYHIAEKDVQDFKDLKTTLDAFAADMDVLKAAASDRKQLAFAIEKLRQKYSKAEIDFDVFAVLEDEIRIVTEEINTKDATWRSHYLTLGDKSRETIHMWRENTRVLPAYLTDETVSAVEDLRTEADSLISKAMIDDVVFYFRKLNSEERIKCLKLLTSQ